MDPVASEKRYERAWNVILGRGEADCGTAKERGDWDSATKGSQERRLLKTELFRV